MDRVRIAWGLGCGVVLLIAACASGPMVCKKDPITGSERCQNTSGSPAEAAATAGAATAAWGIAGCTVNGCEPPLQCNPDTKTCVRPHCYEGQNTCPPGYSCDLKDNLCK
jgi:hypothetical protein